MHEHFVHLRTHSTYSLAEGAIKIDPLIALCQKFNMPAVAVTDSNNMYCSLEFCKASTSAGVQPIVGVVLFLTAQDKILLLAKNSIGYQNLLQLVSKAHLTPPITFETLSNYSAGLIAISGTEESSIGQYILAANFNQAEQKTLELAAIFKDSFYLELQRHGLEAQATIEPKIIDLAYKHNLPLIATNDVYFATKDMHEAHDALLCIAEGKYILDDNRRKFTPEHYFKSASEMRNLFADLPEAIQNTVLIAKRCGVKSEERAPMLPKFPASINGNEAEDLRLASRTGLRLRLETQVYTENMSHVERERVLQTYSDRLDFELSVIIKMDFPGYFLIVSDFIKWSKRNSIPVGPGRGSGAGSVAAWSLEITDLDPLRFGLLFERFLNPDRVSMPDFDIDFCQDRRDEVINYVRQKYGADRVAQIITFGKLQAKAVIRDVGRVMQLPYNQVDRISKMVPFNAVSPVNLSQAIEMEPMLKQAAKEDPQIAKLLDISLQLEGLNRHASTHAAGLVIADRPLVELLPLTVDQKQGSLVVQYSMKYAEAAGLVKFDFLGLKTLTLISNCCKMINKGGILVDINKIPLDDSTTYTMLSQGQSIGVFQFESAGMRDSLRKLRPDAVEDLIALGALYRPGPMDNIPTYIACKHGLMAPDYLHPTLEGVLKETFGVIIYQEQVMQIAQILANYTLAEADLLRRAMGKKIKSEMDDQRELFVSGALSNNIDKDAASNIFDLVAKFAGYGFNKSHAAAYAMISYQTAYLKANFPVEFLVASMNLESDDTEKINIFVQEAKALKIEIIPPNINRSETYFSIDDNKILYGLGCLKSIGHKAMEEIITIRNKGQFKDIFDFAARCSATGPGKKHFEKLIKSGAFDIFGHSRKQLFDSIAIFISYGQLITKEQNSKQISLFDQMKNTAPVTPKLAPLEFWSEAERLNFEFEVFGLYLSAHPLDYYSEYFKQFGIMLIKQLASITKVGFSSVTIAGVVTSSATRSSPRGRYVTLQISDPSSISEISIFDDEVLQHCRELIDSRTPLLIKADLRKDEGSMRLTANNITKLDTLFANKKSRLHLTFKDSSSAQGLHDMLSKNNNAGNSILSFTMKVKNSKQVTIELSNGYDITPGNLGVFNNLPGVIEVKYEYLSLAK
jgi:DNA polymerase-3 subunit alpha